jgi:hypothetical protein
LVGDDGKVWIILRRLRDRKAAKEGIRAVAICAINYVDPALRESLRRRVNCFLMQLSVWEWRKPCLCLMLRLM